MTYAIGSQIIVSSTGNSAQDLTTPGLLRRYEKAPENAGTGTSSPMPAESGLGGKANDRAIQCRN
jgi:hypothetical protein